MNPGKHKKDYIQEWLEGEEQNPAPTRSRSAHLLASYVKLGRPGGRKFRPNLPEQPPAKPDPALLREPAPPGKPNEKHSQTASWEHQVKLERLTPLRAPFPKKGQPHPSPAPVARPAAKRTPPPRQRPRRSPSA